MYVRTKDWIYDTENLHYRWIENNKVYKVGWDVEKPTFEANIINSSKDLAELCDEFIVVGYYPNKPLHFDTLDEAQRFVYNNGCQDRDYVEIKGGIWTEEGFTYTAKTNDKGELKLI